MRCHECGQNCSRAGTRNTAESERCIAFLPRQPKPQSEDPQELAMIQLRFEAMHEALGQNAQLR